MNAAGAIAKILGGLWLGGQLPLQNLILFPQLARTHHWLTIIKGHPIEVQELRQG
jgi:hypothetical protein